MAGRRLFPFISVDRVGAGIEPAPCQSGRAAEQGHARAQHSLVFYYFEGGGGVPQDYKEAEKWCRRVAEQGHGQAQYNLGWMYSEGRGVSQDNVSAHMWSSLAAANGHEGSSELRDEVAGKMNPAQVQRAQDLARGFQVKNESSVEY